MSKQQTRAFVRAWLDSIDLKQMMTDYWKAELDRREIESLFIYRFKSQKAAPRKPLPIRYLDSRP